MTFGGLRVGLCFGALLPNQENARDAPAAGIGTCEQGDEYGRRLILAGLRVPGLCCKDRRTTRATTTAIDSSPPRACTCLVLKDALIAAAIWWSL